MIVFEWMLFSFGAFNLLSAAPSTPVSTNRLQPVALELQVLSTNSATGLFSNMVIHQSPQQWTIQSLQGDTRLGIALASAADVNGDGFNDLLLGVPRFTPRPSAQQAGLAALFLGGPRGLGNAPSWVSDSSRRMGHRGASVALYDWNGDELADPVVNAPSMIDFGKRLGRVYFYDGSTNSLSDSPVSVLQGSISNLYMVSDLVPAGDVNKDGYQDILVASARFTKDFKEEGMVALYLGSNTGLVLAASWQVFGGQLGASFGSAAAGLGDVNGDGYDDVLIGAPGFGDNKSEIGRAFLFLGSPAGLRTNAAWFMDGTEPLTRFGRSVASAGDVNGDGYQDFFISAPGSGPAGDLPGTVYLYLGSKGRISANPAWRIKGESPASAFGYALSLVGDVDGDHRPDLLIGAPNFSGQYTHEGAAFFFRGNGRFFTADPDWILYGGQTDARVGYVVRATGDLNRDGFADFAAGTPFFHVPASNGRRMPELAGRVDVFYGAPTGYCKGQIFPADGIALKPRPSRPAAAPLVAVSASVAIPRPNHFLYSALGFSLIITAGGVFWARHAQRHAARAERVRIARDLHDDLGAQLSRLQRESVSANPQIAREAILALDRAIWSVNPENDTLENLVSFIGQYAADFFSDSGIRLRFQAPVTLPSLQLASEFRKNVFLAVKEALNNVLKHSGGTEVNLHIVYEPRLLTIVVSDNGQGLHSGLTSGGDGLANMAHRMRAVHSRFNISRNDSGGALVSFKIKL